ncbi:hypothetical protein [Nocardia suismassiliense]|uniref:hypothetical protein n=1 Tax=Nocardia suismassiliense TaxID=2077092 RepID=UPI0018FE7A07|nr:hypothetical protein [Nocardia suismassiliense]
MSANAARSTGISGRSVAVLGTLAVGLVAAFVAAPGKLAANGSSESFGDESSLRAALRVAFVEYWSSGDRDFPPALSDVVDYWFRYHVVKALIAAVLLIVLVALAVLLWRAFLRGTRNSPALASAGGLVTLLALASLVLVMANIQGAVAPFSALLPMLTTGAPDGLLADTLDQIRLQLADSLSAGGRTSPALDVMISDFARYHVAMAVIAAVAALVLIAMSIASWTAFARTTLSDRRSRRVWGSFGALFTVVTLALLVIAAVNTSTAADSAPALLAFFEGGW